MKIYKFEFDYPASCYVVASEEKNAFVVDPSDAAKEVISLAKEENLNIKYILLTHGHFDHIMTLCELQKATGAQILIHKDDGIMIESVEESLAVYTGKTHETTKDYTPLNGGEILKIDELEVEVFATPGHTPGSVCYICQNAIFAGDTLFKGSIGRTDLPRANYDLMKTSLKKLYNLKGDYKVFSGHGDDTTLSKEKISNPYLKQAEGL